MGCDIHCYKEKRVNGKFVAADVWEAYDYGPDDRGLEVPYERRFTNRNYELFGALSAGVRTEHPFSFQPRGLPFDCCEEVRQDSEGWGVDGHGHSYLYLHELQALQAHLQTVTIRITGMKDRMELAELQATINAGKPDWSLLFPYCDWTNAVDHPRFELDVPASFYLGRDLQQLIDLFDGVDGDLHRIVFWFDN